MRLMKQDCRREMGSVCAFAYECLTMTKDHNDKAKKRRRRRVCKGDSRTGLKIPLNERDESAISPKRECPGAILAAFLLFFIGPWVILLCMTDRFEVLDDSIKRR